MYVLVQDTADGPVDVMTCGTVEPQYNARSKTWVTNPDAAPSDRVCLTDGGDVDGKPVLRIEQR